MIVTEFGQSGLVLLEFEEWLVGGGGGGVSSWCLEGMIVTEFEQSDLSLLQFV